MKIPLGLLITTVVALGGCASPEQRAAWQAEQNRQEQARNQAYRENLMRQCANIGYHYDTDGMRQCVLTLHGQNMQALGAAAASRPAPVYVNPPIRPPVTTNCQTWVPGQTTCTTR